MHAAHIKTSQGITNCPIAKLILEISMPMVTETEEPTSVSQKDTLNKPMVKNKVDE